MKPGTRGVQRLVKAWGYSLNGLQAALRHEAAFRQEAAATLVLLPLALWLGDTGVERALLVASWLLVPMTELLNSGLEAIVDKTTPEHHELAGRAKDMGSASVFLAIVSFVLVWGIMLVARFY